MENQESPVTDTKRRRASREEKQQHIMAQASSGLSVAAYCREHEIRYGNFLNWQRQASAATPSFRPLELIEDKSSGEAVVEIRYGSGTIFQVQKGCSERMAIALAKILT